MGYGQFAATSQFYLYGRKHCTATGYENAMKKVLKKGGGADPLADPSLSLAGKVAMVTGANSGVGKEIATFLAKKGAAVFMVCRSKERGEAALAEIVEITKSFQSGGNKNVHLLLCDLQLESEVRKMWAEFERIQASSVGGDDNNSTASSSDKASEGEAANGTPPQLDVLVCNAGVLLNEKTLTSEGVEVTLACHLLFGTYLLGKLAMPSLEATAGARLVVVSSGGMYNTKFPEWDVATSRKGKYDGNLVYAYAKRGQVLLMEEWAKMYPTVKCVTCHPGWTQTPAVDAAYGKDKKYLEPMRDTWQGADGIVWLCVAPEDEIESGAFYLDRTPRVKHMAGPFFSEGTFTKNSRKEIDAMMAGLDDWSSGRGPTADSGASAATPDTGKKLRELERAIDIKAFMGRWFVVAGIPTYFEQDKMNSIEDYEWDEAKERINVVFRMQSTAESKPTVLLQRATIANKATNTKWHLNPKFGVFLPLALDYLIVDCADDYSTCIIGVPDRKYLWIMSRSFAISDGNLSELIEKAVASGFSRKKIIHTRHDYGAEGAPEFAFKDAETKRATIAAAEAYVGDADDDERGEEGKEEL